MDQELKAYLDEQFGRQGEQLARQSEQLARHGEQLARQGERLERLEERVTESSRQIEGLKDESRQTRVLIEGTWDKIRLLAEGLMGAIEQQKAHRNEIQAGFEDVKASIATPYKNLDRRVQWLEARAERQTRDVFEVIREEFGIPQR